MYKSKSNIAINLNDLKEQLSKDDYDTLITINDNTKGKYFTKKKEHLVSNCNSLKNTADHLHILIVTTGSVIKERIVNLTGEALDENKIKLLNLGPKFVPKEKQKEIMHGHYLNYRNLYIRFRTGRKI